ncbi:DUF3368 domain-containing protein [Candidatus Woesearchaeota archaeon]|nr:DUF3368 domain-containing protein [Candidatus Woesearchaeota archaeon]
MIVVSNASPIIFLSKIRKLDLLLKLYKEIYIPIKVLEELLKGKDDTYLDRYIPKFKAEEIKGKISALQLHEGELEAISLAVEKKADLVLLDDKKARIVAKGMKLKVKGTLGLLLTFLDKKLISHDEFKLLLDILVNANFRISINLFKEALKQAEEITNK